MQYEAYKDQFIGNNPAVNFLVMDCINIADLPKFIFDTF